MMYTNLLLQCDVIAHQILAMHHSAQVVAKLCIPPCNALVDATSRRTPKHVITSHACSKRPSTMLMFSYNPYNTYKCPFGPCPHAPHFG